MWIVRVALTRPYTFIVLALMVFIMSRVVITRTPRDIFPSIDIPVVAVDWTVTGLNPEELEGRLTSPYERVHRMGGSDARAHSPDFRRLAVCCRPWTFSDGCFASLADATGRVRPENNLQFRRCDRT
jgi:hypothetical protein